MIVVLGWLTWAKILPENFQNLYHIGISNAIKNLVGDFFGAEDALVAQDSQVLGNIALGCFHLFENFVDAAFFFDQEAENAQAHRVGHGFEQICGLGEEFFGEQGGTVGVHLRSK